MDMELESSCFGMEGSKMEGGLMKILGRATLKIKKNLRNQYSQNWLETNISSTTSREKFTHKEVKELSIFT